MKNIIICSLTVISFLAAAFAAEQPVEANLVARVGSQNITADRLSEKITVISDREENAHLSYLQRRELALEELIKEELLYNYATERGISVTAGELDDYFILLYGDHERVTTNGVFDPRKYRELKRLPEIRELLNNLRRDLMMDKAEAIIRSMFQYSEDDLIERFFSENTEVDISYVLMKEESIAIPYQIHPSAAYDYYEAERSNYEPVRELELDFFIVPFSMMRDKTASIDINEEQINEYISRLNAQELSRLIDLYLYGQNSVLSHTVLSLRNGGLFDEEPDLAAGLSDILAAGESPLFHSKLKEIIREEKAELLAHKEAVNAAQRLRDRLSIPYRVLSVTIYDRPYDSYNSPLFRSNTLLPAIRNAAAGNISEPLKTGFGYFVFRLNNKRTSQEKIPAVLAGKVWDDFITGEIIYREKDLLVDTYRENIDKLTVPAVHITKLQIDRDYLHGLDIPDKELETFYRQNRSSVRIDADRLLYDDLYRKIREAYIEHKEKELREWCADNLTKAGYELQALKEKEYKKGVKGFNELVYLERFGNSPLSEHIRQTIRQPADTRIRHFEDESSITYYKINSWYPSFLPAFNDIASYLYNEHRTGNNEDRYRQFYEANIIRFNSPDSLKLAGVFFPREIDKTSVTEQELREYYDDKKEHLFTEHRAEIEYVRIDDPGIKRKDFAYRLYNLIEEGVEIEILQKVFGNKSETLSGPYCTTYGSDVPPPVQQPAPVQRTARTFLPSKAGMHSGIIVTLSGIPETLSAIITGLSLQEVCKPVYFRDGWYIIKKTREMPPVQASLAEMRFLLTEEIRRNKAEQAAAERAARAFVEVTSITDLYAFPDSTKIFFTGMKPDNEEFGPLGSISGYLPRLRNLRINGRLNTIYTNEAGFGILFLLNKKSGSQLSYEEAYRLVKESFHADSRIRKAQNYAQYLKDLIVAGEDPSSLLVFWGGWHRERNLTFNDLLPGVIYGDLIIKNAALRAVGDVSHIIKNGEDEYLFYRLDRKVAVSKDCYEREKDSFRKRVIETDFYRWLRDYGHRIGVEKF